MALSGLRARLFLLLGIAVLPAITLLLYGQIQQRRSAEREIHDQALNLARLTAQAHAERIETARQLLISLSNNTAMRADGATCGGFVRALTPQYEGSYATIGRADAGGSVDCLALDGATDGMTIADREYFQRAKSTAGFIVGDFMHGKVRRQPTLAFAMPLLSPAGAVTHVIFANADLAVLSRGLEAQTQMAGTTVSLLDRNGAIIARSTDAERFLGVTASAAQVATMKTNGEMVATFNGADGTPRVFSIVAIRDRTGNIVAYATVGIPTTAVASLVDSGQNGAWIPLAALAVGLLLAAWMGSELLIRRPVRKLMIATAALANGDLDARTPPVGGVHELNVLASAFNTMAGKLQQRELHLREGQRLEAVGQLAGGIAHDFNNLLTIIIGYADVLKDGFDRGSIEATQLSELRAASERAAKLTQQLLAFSRRQLLMPSTLQLNDVVGDMVSLLRRTTGGDVTIHVLLDPNLSSVYADRVQMEQVLLNLVINARDAMPTGGQVTIETRNRNISGEQVVELSVRDSGIGMDSATRAKIFEPFFTTKGVKGTGLGLATVYGIVKQSGGELECDTEIGRGTCFRVRLPRSEGSHNSAPQDDPIELKTGTETILLVDDDHAVRTVVEAMLRRHGYRVDSSASASDALARVSGGSRPDLVLTDVRMPGMNGSNFASALRGLCDAPVVFMSGEAAQLLSSQDMARGEVFLQKPIAISVLLQTVRQVLDTRA